MMSLSLPLQAAPGALKLPAIIADHMVMQNGQEDALWGWASAGTAVKAEFLSARGTVLVQASAKASVEGKWSIKLPSPPLGTLGQLRFTAGSDVITLQDVAVGEAWLCGGQSNMTYDFGFGNIPPEQIQAAKEQAAKERGMIRFFLTDAKGAPTPQEDSGGKWFVATPENLGRCSCVAWYFAVALREKLDRPMGMIVCAVGGTRVEQWMSKEALDSLPHGPEVEKQQLQQAAEAAPKIKAWQDADDAWIKVNPTPELQAQNKALRPVRHAYPPAMFAELYNGMLHGLEPFSVKGVIWFQADGNLGATPLYGELIQGLIKNWRADFGAELPFYYVEMNNMRDDVQVEPVKYNELSLLREQQTAALNLPKTDVVCSIDVGLPEFEPHFPNKQPVGQRLAAVALDHLYGFPGVCHGPTYDSFTVAGSNLRIHFKNAEGLRVRGAGEMKGFAIRGAAGDWVWAEGKVDGADLLLWNDKIPHPAAARYAWAANPVTSMENGAGFPMRPFRTDKDSPQ